ncbi:MAG: hypothetical protein ACI31E_01845 [Muribaculaceae bacterium]
MKKHIIIPAVLLIYLGVMSYIGYPEYKSGHFTPLYYFGIIGLCLCIIVLLHFFIKKREQLRHERQQDIENSAKDHKKADGNDKTSTL